MIYIIEDDQSYANCLARYLKKYEVKIFTNCIDAMNAINAKIPDLIFLDVLLTGPDGFTLLHELASYPDTEKIPIVIVSSLNFDNQDLKIYGVVGTLKKEELTPKEVLKYASRYSN